MSATTIMCTNVAKIEAARLRPSQSTTSGQTTTVTMAEMRIVAVARVMTIAIKRRFQKGLESLTPRMACIASMISTKTLDESQSVAARPNESRPTRGSALSRLSSCSIKEAAWTGNSHSSGSIVGSSCTPPAKALLIHGSPWARRAITSPMKGTSAAIP